MGDIIFGSRLANFPISRGRGCRSITFQASKATSNGSRIPDQLVSKAHISPVSLGINGPTINTPHDFGQLSDDGVETVLNDGKPSMDGDELVSK